MIITERVPLRTLTTFRVGGEARYVATCNDEHDVRSAITFAREHALPFVVLGGGSNVLPEDGGYEGVVIQPQINTLSFGAPYGGNVRVDAGASISWDALVAEAAHRSLWGIENLAGIPGSVGAAPVQNIGAYGTELSDTLQSVDVFDALRDCVVTLSKAECGFGYRDSVFKRNKNLIILSVSLLLTEKGAPELSYKDLAAYARHTPLTTAQEVGNAVRAIRAKKFPDLALHGTAGSFFKNPVISQKRYDALCKEYEGLPGFPSGDGIKVSLAWILDNVLMLRGYRKGHAWLHDAQPLVLVADRDASARDIETLADEVAARVYEKTGIILEREVHSLSDKK